MTTANELFKAFESLSPYEQEVFYEVLSLKIEDRKTYSEVQQKIVESKFSRGRFCPKCGSLYNKKHGIWKGRQRYYCNDCHRTFSDYSDSPMAYSKRSLTLWLKYAHCMVNGKSIRQSAEIVGISVPTAFFWRHKILNAMTRFLGKGHVDGIVEADETFFEESFKGNHKKSKSFAMPRKSHKRGPKSYTAKELRKRGLSGTKICVATALDRSNNLVVEMACKGQITQDALKRLYADRIDPKSIICTDYHQGYTKLAKHMSLEHKRFRKKSRDGVYHIQHINALHSNMKRWFHLFRGVSTKYLGNYLYWFKWLEIFKTEKQILKSRDFLVNSNAGHQSSRVADFKYQKPAFV